MPSLGPSVTGALRGLVERFVYGGAGASAVPRPPCRPQRPLGRLAGQPGLFPRLEPLTGAP